MNGAKDFKILGPITNPEKQIYIERPEDTEVLQALYRGDYITLLGARQTGKSSLLYKLASGLKTEIPVLVDLSSFSKVDKDDWYGRVARTVVKRLPQELKNMIGEVNFCTDHEQFRNLLWEIADALAGPDRLVLLLDEMGTVPEEIRDGFFSTIRSIYIERGSEEAFQKYLFVLAGVTPLTKLISPESEMSPFNISRIIYMSDFNLEGVRELGDNLRLYGFTIDNSVIEHIYDWTHGHPNLTQEIFARLIQATPEKVTEETVDYLVDELVIKGCNNLDHIIRKMQDEVINQEVFGILNGKKRFFNLSDPEVLNLYLIGVIGKGEKGECVIRNKVYEKTLRSIKSQNKIKTLEEKKDDIFIFKLLDDEEVKRILLDRGYIMKINNGIGERYVLTE